MARRLSRVFLTSLALLGYPPSIGLGAPIRVTFAGQVSQATATTELGSFFASIGDPFTGSMVYDPDLLVVDGGPYYHLEPASWGALQLASAGQTADAAVTSFVIADGTPGSSSPADTWVAETASLTLAPPGVSLPDVSLAIFLSSPDGAQVPSVDPPGSLDGWTTAFLLVLTDSTKAGLVPIASGTLSEWSVTAPEPGALALVGVALSVVRFLRMRAR